MAATEGGLVKALVDVIGRSGARHVKVIQDEEEDLTIWIAVAAFMVDEDGHPVPEGGELRHEVSAGRLPVEALSRLADTLIGGAECQHCHRPSGITEDWQRRMPLSDAICWYVFDPETETFRRSCEGETT